MKLTMETNLKLITDIMTQNNTKDLMKTQTRMTGSKRVKTLNLLFVNPSRKALLNRGSVVISI